MKIYSSLIHKSVFLLFSFLSFFTKIKHSAVSVFSECSLHVECLQWWWVLSVLLLSHLSLPVTSLFKAASSSPGKDKDRWRGRESGGGGFKMPSRRKTSSNPIPPSLSPPPPPPPPPQPPHRSRRKSKSPSSRSNYSAAKRALDLDKIGATSDPEDSRQSRRGSRDLRGSQGSELDRKWEGVALELRCRGSRMRSAVYQTSDLPSMVKAKRHLEQSESKGQTDRSKLKATFVWGSRCSLRLSSLLMLPLWLGPHGPSLQLLKH